MDEETALPPKSVVIPSRRQIKETAQNLTACRLIRERRAKSDCLAEARDAALEVSNEYELKRRTFARLRSLRWNKVYIDKGQ